MDMTAEMAGDAAALPGPKTKNAPRKVHALTKAAVRLAKKAKPKTKTKKVAKRKAAKKADNVVRSERLDMRLTKAEKAKVNAKAKKTRRTVTSLIIEAIEKIR